MSATSGASGRITSLMSDPHLIDHASSHRKGSTMREQSIAGLPYRDLEQLPLPGIGGSLWYVRSAIESLYAQDRVDRAEVAAGRLPPAALDARDNRRCRIVRQLLLDGHVDDDLLRPHDAYRAAMVFQHGPGIASIRRARRLAMRAARCGLAEARQLAAAALDRRLMYEGKPQKYGTQYRREGGQWFLWPINPRTSDAERAKWAVPPVADAVALAHRWNNADEHRPSRVA